MTIGVADFPLPYHRETVCPVRASADVLFAYLDDHARLAAHMSKSSWMMGGSRMTIETDDGAGRVPGSHIRMRGRFLGLHLSLDEVVIEHEAPRRKVWQAIGTPRLIVIGHYRMGFAISEQGDRSSLRVFIDYALPGSWPSRWVGHLLGGVYARWCLDSMANDAARHFQGAASG